MDWEAWWTLGLTAATLALPFVMLFIVPRDRKPSSAIAWLLVIAILPWVGLVLFLILGNPRLPRDRRRRQLEMEQIFGEVVSQSLEDPRAQPWIRGVLPDSYTGLGKMGSRLGVLPPFGGNRVEVLSDYSGTIADIAKAIRQAQRFVHLQYYILAQDDTTEPVIQAMEDAARRGVTVRVLMDHLGSRGYPGYGALKRRLRTAGAQVELMLPFDPLRGKMARPDLRNHRKIVVVDGDVGYIGSQNMIGSGYVTRRGATPQYEYLDLVARVRGPLVQQLDAVFFTDWHAETGKQSFMPPAVQPQEGTTVGQVLPSGPGHTTEANLRVFNALLYRARQRIVIVTAYFVPDETLMMALTTAAQRGVRVSIITPERGNQMVLRHAQRSFYGDLLRAGVRIFLHPRPWNLHTKTISIDDDACVIGSSNLDIRSFQLNLEVSLLCYGAEVVRPLRAVEDAYIAQCREIDLGEWEGLSAPSRLLDNLARLTSSLQ